MAVLKVISMVEEGMGGGGGGDWSQNCLCPNNMVLRKTSLIVTKK